MREIKFRTWYKLNNFMKYFKEDEYLRFSDFKTNNWSEPMQYTGLKDKNGKEIYEGDIVKALFPFDETVIGIINFDHMTFKLKNIKQSNGAIEHGYVDFYRFWNDGVHDWESLENLCMEESEIIGNIYENPELLK